EPTAGVDVELRRQLWDYVRELNRQGTTVLLTTHYLEEAEELCDYVAIINHGKIIANDSTRALLQLMDSRQVILRFDRAVKAQELPQPLQTYAPEQREDNVIAITFKSGELTITDILNFTHSANLGITDLTTREPDLEDTFRHLINQ
ncbi:MAG: hypothetical protein KDD76_02510, partial [Rickettsiales bacterium]|nr:hypothetical protein [Rickettsiales bacterium]